MARHTRFSSRPRLAVLAAAALAVPLAACDGGGDGGDGGEGTAGGDGAGITVWIQEDLPDRVAATQAIVDDYVEATGTEVELVPVAEDQFNQLLTSSAAAGDLPDVIGGASLPQVRSLSANELIEPDVAGQIIEGLDAGTFNESAIELVSDEGTALAVPSESWTQLLVYRADLFEEAGLEPPETYEAITAAAEELNGDGMAGFVGANAPADAFTEQTFEHIALGNNCQLVDDAGEVTFGNPECVEALDFYGTLISDYSVSGIQDVDTVRAQYFAGEAAMMVWSTFILDELAGLRDDALPTCEECADDPGWLAENSGIVTSISGPSGTEPVTFGEITSWLVPAEADTEGASEFITYMMNDGYMPWIAIAPEGKVPVRTGTPEEPETYSEQWAELEVGVDTKAPLTDFYGEDVITALTEGASNLNRWAIPQGQGNLLGALQGEQPVAGAVNAVTTGTPAEEAAQSAAETISSVADSMR
ncbi:ABC transporter substrate-binding protein [Ornithinimicrobium pekingense]|uniref:Bicyclomycin resistance protein n=1 Tax=Ornithinimicrobium pekingense TaxID=384677 RepID=A0ABQ2F4U8_9MICO|nr:extracellular solute-binding protein [Ornithinimicrobium pekingense]GGK60718.1 bicyclomycin resistance protein [Ornithinimicrobium pekingense]